MTPLTGRRLILAVGAVLVFGLLQICAIDDISFPIGRPDLPVLAVLALALTWGPAWGASVGFAAGLMLDLAPPADHAVGQLAFTYAIVGYAAGLLADGEERSVVATIVIVIVGCIGLVGIDVALGTVIGATGLGVSFVARLVIATVGYDVILAPFVVPMLTHVARRTEPAGVR